MKRTALAITVGVALAFPGPAVAGIPQSVQAEFVQTCTQNGGTRAECRCFIRKIERRYSLDGFTRMILRVDRTGAFPRDVFRMGRSCARAY